MQNSHYTASLLAFCLEIEISIEAINLNQNKL